MKKAIGIIVGVLICAVVIGAVWAYSLWKNPIVAQIDQTMDGYLIREDGSMEPCQVTLSGVSRHFRVQDAASPDNFEGQISFNGNYVKAYIEYYDGREYGFWSYLENVYGVEGSDTKHSHFILGKEMDFVTVECWLDADGKMTAQDAGTPALLLAPAPGEADIPGLLAQMGEIMEEFPALSEDYHCEWWNLAC